MAGTFKENDGEHIPTKHRNLKAPWKPGQSGNPAGRPKGARSNLGEAFLQDCYELWKTEGKSALLQARVTDPMGFCRMMATILPKELTIKTDPYEEMTVEQLRAFITGLAVELGFVGSWESPGQPEAGGGPEPAIDISCLPEVK